MPETVLVIDDDRHVTEAVSMLLDRCGLTTFVCSDVESAELLLSRQTFTRVLTDVQFSGRFGYEGLHFLSRLRMLQPSCHIVLMTGFASDDLRAAAASAGANELLAKPFGLVDLEGALQIPACSEGAHPYEVVHVTGIDEILASPNLTTAFQPIVGLQNEAGTPFGFEALTRLHDWPGGGVEELFAYASQKGRLTELNLAAIRSALTQSQYLPESATMFVNVDPVTFDGPGFAGILLAEAAKNSFALSRLVLEITERSGFDESGNAARAFAELRGLGVRFALDDHGSAHSHLSAITDILPAFIKISRSFGTGFEADATRERIVRNVLALARDFDCRTILEGIETEATARAAVKCGIEYGQGYLFGKPHAVTHWGAARFAA